MTSMELVSHDLDRAGAEINKRNKLNDRPAFPSTVPFQGSRAVRSGGAPATPLPIGQDQPPAKEEFPFEELDIVVDRRAKVFWQFMKPKGRPSYTMGLLRDMRRALHYVKGMFDDSAAEEKTPVRYLVLASRMPGVFNLGGNLPRFVELIRAKDKAALQQYAYACIDVQYPRAINLDLPIISISLVQGDALGGGFEAALADDLIIAEKGAKFGLPEILFGLFPGMGAYTFLSRKLDATRAERLILSGRIYSAEELHDMGVVDFLAEQGKGEQAVYDFVHRSDRTFHARRSVYRARQIANPVTREELVGITDLWVEAALSLEVNDLRKMERLASAQDRRWASMTFGAKA